MHLFSSILLLLVAARLLGEIAYRLKQPTIVGEILAGILLGPSVLNYVTPTEQLSGISELSVFLIVLAAGLEMNIVEVANSIRGRGVVAASADFVIPLFAGILVALLFGYNLGQASFVGLCMSITALPVAVRILEDFKLLGSSVAQYSIATSIINDVTALLCFGVILDLKAVSELSFPTFLSLVLGKFSNLFWLISAIVVGSILTYWGAKQQRMEKILTQIMNLFGKEALFGLIILFVLLFGSLSENLGFHFIIGAFFASALISREALGKDHFEKLEEIIDSVSSGFLAPLFFGYIGLHFRMDFLRAPLFPLLVLLAAMGSKIWAGWIGARWLKMSRAEALGIGIILNGRGIMELVVANVGLQQGIIDTETFSALVLMGVVTTVLTPLLFRKFVLSDLVAQYSAQKPSSTPDSSQSKS